MVRSRGLLLLYDVNNAFLVGKVVHRLNRLIDAVDEAFFLEFK